jgi:hypothetical protein
LLTQLLLTFLNPQRLGKINRFIARGVQLLAGVQLGGFDRRIAAARLCWAASREAVIAPP